MERLLVSGPSITQKEIDYVADAVTNAWYANANVYHERFERAFAEYVGRRYAIALPSCTSAIHLSWQRSASGLVTTSSCRMQLGSRRLHPSLTWAQSLSSRTWTSVRGVFRQSP
jgi:perosamine synthetase